MSTGKRRRFEILKRDGFRCRYCGANAASTLLHVDHVVPVAEGGTDDPENLVAACADCNLGKSSVPLGESRLGTPDPTEAMLEHAEQMRAYAAAVQARQDAKDAIAQMVVNRWGDRLGVGGMPNTLYRQLGYWIDALGLDEVLAAVDAVGAATHVIGELSQRKYFIAVLRNKRDKRNETTSQGQPLTTYRLPEGHSGPIEIIVRDHWRCRCCGVSYADDALTVGCVVEPQFGGDDSELVNLVTRCSSCDLQAFNRMPVASDIRLLCASAEALLTAATTGEKRDYMVSHARHIRALVATLPEAWRDAS